MTKAETLKIDTIGKKEPFGVKSLATDVDGKSAESRILEVGKIYTTERSFAGKHISREELVLHGHKAVSDAIPEAKEIVET